MKRISQITIVAFFVSCGVARAGMVLLATHNEQTGVGVAPQDEMGVQFVLELFDQDSGQPGPWLGNDVFWRQGETGTMDFTLDSASDFLPLAELASNGVNDNYTIFAIWPDGTGGGGGGFESRLFGRSPHAGEPPDFLGYELELIRLTVRDVDFQPWPGAEGDGFRVEYDLTYDFYGSPIPEPGTSVLLFVGMVHITRRRIILRRAPRLRGQRSHEGNR